MATQRSKSSKKVRYVSKDTWGDKMARDFIRCLIVAPAVVFVVYALASKVIELAFR